jgi:transposase-like protein
VSLLVAIGVNGEGYRAGWSDFLKHLKGRGLHGVQLIISDACMGLAESAAEFFPETAWQRCIVHWYRNIFSHVPSTKVREVAAMLKAIHAGEDLVAARQQAVRAIEKLRGLRLTKQPSLWKRQLRRRLPTTPFRRNTGDAFAPTIRSGAFCARLDGAHASSARSRTGNRRSILPPTGRATSPAPRGRPTAI